MAGTGVAIAVGDATPLLDDNGSGVYVKGRNTAHDIRLGLLGSLFQQSSDGITPRAGVLISFWDGANYDFAVLPQGTPDQTVTIKRGRAIVARSGQGGYIVNMETDQIVTMPAASASNSRVDIVCIAVFDKGNFVGDVAHGPQIWVEQGALGGGAPATPAGMLKIAELTRAVNDNAISAGEITDRRYVTGLNQGIRPYVGSEVNGSGITGVAGVYPNEIRFGPSQLERWNISTSLWDPITFPLGSSGYGEWAQTAAQTIGTSNNQRVLFDSNPVPAGGDLSTATVSGGTEFTVNRAGVWDISGTMRINGAAGNGVFERAVVLAMGTATTNRFGGMNNYDPNLNSAASPFYVQTQYQFAGKRRFAVGDKFAVWLWQNSGGSLATNVGLDSNRMQACWLRP
jgi:hypothetical protein